VSDVRLRPRHLLIAAVGCAFVFAAILLAVYHTPEGRWLDNAALEGFLSILDSTRSTTLVGHVASLCDPGPYIVIAMAIVGTALVRRTPRRAAGAAVLLVGASATTQILKPVLAQARFDASVVGWHHVVNPVIPAPAFPSGHSTAAMAIALAALMVVPRALRPLTAAAGALFALAIGFSVVALGWHYPSDVVGGYLVATAWCLVILAALKAADARWPEAGTLRAAARSKVPTAIAPAGAVVGAALLGVGLARADRLAGFAGAHTTATVAAIGISLCAAVLVAAVSLVDQRRR
jgi:membrane-associated phospholipid phosphatase